MAKFIIIGDKGSTFTSTEPDKLDQQMTYDNHEEAERFLKDIQSLFPYEKFKIEQIR